MKCTLPNGFLFKKLGLNMDIFKRLLGILTLPFAWCAVVDLRLGRLPQTTHFHFLHQRWIGFSSALACEGSSIFDKPPIGPPSRSNVVVVPIDCCGPLPVPPVRTVLL